MDKNHFGKKIKRLRMEAGLTGKELGEKVGLTQCQISRLERGLDGMRSRTLLKLAKALDVPAVYFFQNEDGSGKRKLVEVLEDKGFKPSKALLSALNSSEFLAYIEASAKAARAKKDNLARMMKAVKRVK